MLEEVVKHERSMWQLAKSVPSKPTSNFFALGTLKKEAPEGHVSWIEFVNAITKIDVQNTTDGLRRRGIVTSR